MFHFNFCSFVGHAKITKQKLHTSVLTILFVLLYVQYNVAFHLPFVLVSYTILHEIKNMPPQNPWMKQFIYVFNSKAQFLNIAHPNIFFNIFVCLFSGVFIICWLPFFITHIVNTYWQVPPELYTAFTWLGYVNSAVNPIIYTTFNIEFRKAFIKILHCWERTHFNGAEGMEIIPHLQWTHCKTLFKESKSDPMWTMAWGLHLLHFTEIKTKGMYINCLYYKKWFCSKIISPKNEKKNAYKNPGGDGAF